MCFRVKTVQFLQITASASEDAERENTSHISSMILFPRIFCISLRNIDTGMFYCLAEPLPCPGQEYKKYNFPLASGFALNNATCVK